MSRADQRKFHYIYKITRTDGKYYIGMHSTDDLEDGYFGSGTLLAASIREHGKEVHSKEILEFLPTRKDLKTRERELVNEDLLGDVKCMNLKLGGEGGWKKLSFEQRSSISKEMWKSPEYRTERLPAAREKMNLRWIESAEVMLDYLSQARSVALQPENLAKRKATFDKIKHQSGSSNSQFGTKWVSKDGVVKKIKVDELNQYLTDGWKAGRK